MSKAFDIHRSGTDVFWGEIPPSEHMLQIYEDDAVFLDTLHGFVAGGLRAGDGVVVIGTDSHLASLRERLTDLGDEPGKLEATGQYVPLLADDVLAEFLVDGWPDEKQFESLITGILERATGPGRKVRAFGEMVAILWGRGDQGATVRLEYLWHRLCHTRGFSLLCAYPATGFTNDAASSINELCRMHSMVLSSGRTRAR